MYDSTCGVSSLFKGFLRQEIGVDLGTVNTLIYISNQGVVLREPSVVAPLTMQNNVLAVGEAARAMLRAHAVQGSEGHAPAA